MNTQQYFHWKYNIIKNVNNFAQFQKELEGTGWEIDKFMENDILIKYKTDVKYIKK